jgi:TPR repeat protein
LIEEKKMNLRTSIAITCAAFLSAACIDAPQARADISAAEQAAPPRLDNITVAELEARMARGDMTAQAELGARYGRGDGVPQSLERAIQLLRQAAEKGDASAQYYLGTAYANGAGVPGNLTEASLWYEKAAAQRYAPAEFQLGVFIAYGRAGIEPSWPAAIPYLWDAADRGFGDAELILAEAFSKGYGVERNPRAAAYWFRRNISRHQDLRAKISLRELINAGDVEWEAGDPGEIIVTTENGQAHVSVKP